MLLSDPIGRQRSIQGSENWKGQNYAAFQNYRGEWHDQGWWHNHYNRIVLISGGWRTVSDVLPFGRLRYGEPDAISNAISYAKFYSRSHDAMICVFDEAGDVIETHEQTGEFREL